VEFVDEVLDHLAHEIEVGDHAILHRSDREDFAGSSAQHALGLGPEGLDAAGATLDGHDGRLIDDDTATLDMDQCVRRPEIDPDIVGEEGKEAHEGSGKWWVSPREDQI
jgi:hypothetical protein